MAAPAVRWASIPTPRRLQANRRSRRQRAELTPASKPQPDSSLVKVLARAWRWQKLLDTSVYTFVTEIAQAEGINKS